MYQAVADYIKGCDMCQRAKQPAHAKRVPLTNMPIQDTFSRWHLDIIGPFQALTKESYRYILIIVDSFSKWTEAFPVRFKSAEEISRILHREIFSRYGTCHSLVTDRGQGFASKLVAAINQIYNVKHSFSSSYHPQTNSVAERTNKTIIQYSYGLSDDSFRIIRVQSFLSCFGKEMNLPLDTNLIPKPDINKNLVHHIKNVLDNLKIARTLATENLKHAQEYQKLHYDKNTELPTFEIQDQVLLYSPKVPVGLSSKLHRKFDGPFYIARKGLNHTNKLRRCSNNKELKSMINANRLKLYHPPDHRRDLGAPDDDVPRQDPMRIVPPNFVQPPQNDQQIDRNPQSKLFNLMSFSCLTYKRALSYATIIWIMLFCIQQVEPTREIVQRINYGVVFSKKSNIIFGQEFWHHTFQVPIPKKEESQPYPSCDIVHQHCYILNQAISQLSAVRAHISSNINHTVDTIHQLVSKENLQVKSKIKSKSKRGLFDFIGSISKSLFGTATVKDVNRLARHMNILSRNSHNLAKSMAHHDELLSSYMSKTDKRFDNIVSEIQNNHDFIQNVTQETAKFITEFEKVSAKLSSLSLKQMNDSSEINKYLEEITIGVHELLKGKLSPFLIPPHVLKHTISQIQIILNDKFKVPINSSSTHATQILDLPKYLVVSSDNQYYGFFSHEKLQSCTGSHILYCIESLSLISSASPDCVSKQNIHKFCDFRFLLDVVKPSIQPISNNAVLVYKTNTLAFDCQNFNKIVKGCNFCLLNIPCMCSVSTDMLFLPKKVDQCQNNSDSVTILHPVNLALIKSFFSSETYNSIMGVTTFTNPAVLNLPNLNFYNHSFSQFIAQDQQLHFSLKRIAQATKKDKVIFKSLSESMLDGQISAIESWPDFNGIISLVALGLSIIMTVAYVLLFNKVRALTTALILLQKSPSISAFVTPITPPTFNFVRNVQSTTSETYKVDFISQLVNQSEVIVNQSHQPVSGSQSLH
ncbi:unnamed protein product [Mytilus coruscus]|uniref:Integrase catalytic domain-containing protein n=1 Tax=Mytilus coruscus TaxID=42192 RepID=A0A6J8AL84_MYTCO|nr:unnamed protein product [Mytilus coruscus]